MAARIAQMNGARSAMGIKELKFLMDREEVNTLLIQEPYARHDISWPECQMFFKAGGSEDIWTLTVVRCPSLKVVMHGNLSNSVCTAVEVMHAAKFLF